MRYAMLVFVLGFGAFAYYQGTHRVPLAPGEEGGSDPNLLRWVGLGLCAIVVAGIAVIRRVREQADTAKRSTLALVGSSLAEGSAMFGAVIMFLGGDVVVWVVGTVLLIATFTMLPADPEQA
ncbi:MAG TPA: hypothetical protein VJT67_13010 [Longimicrobiaceae bacterium]|nr:hypothetical protein [Longimicrobiaceae bacterium]